MILFFDNSQQMDNKKTISILVTIISIVSLILITPVSVDAVTTYHKGKVWSSDSSHTNEFHNGNIPFAIDTVRLSNNLELASGTTINDIYTEIESAMSLWNDSTDASLERYDVATGHYDNKITSDFLDTHEYAISGTWDHWVWNWLDSGYDNHIIRAKIILNDDGNNVIWDHDGYNEAKNEVNTKNILTHELGHTLELCDTYNSGDQNDDECTGVIDTVSVMSNSGIFSADKPLSATDISTINGKY